MVRTNQSGSILGFVIIASVMAVLLVGGAYAVRHSLVPADATSTAQQSDDKDSSEAAKNQSDQPSKDEDAKQPSETPSQQTAVQPQPETKSPEDLPVTGMADIFAGGVMLSGLAALIAAYKRSRQLSISL